MMDGEEWLWKDIRLCLEGDLGGFLDWLMLEKPHMLAMPLEAG
jgi:hypothetical protein